MEFSSSNVMAYILYKCREDKHPINKTQAQKILYCCYGIIMAKFNERLTDEHPKAWLYGPVFLKTLDDINNQKLTVSQALEFLHSCPQEWIEWIDKTIATFRVYTAKQLSAWSHMKGSPWAKADPLASLDDREIGLFFKPYMDEVEKRRASV